MLKKIITAIFILTLLTISLFSVYQNAPRSPIKLTSTQLVPDETAIIEYGAVPVFAKNLRFNHKVISYAIDDNCSQTRKDAMLEAFFLFSDEMKIISFYETKRDADIDIGCSNDYIELGENLFAAGEGGPSRIINTSLFKTIEKGKIWIYDDPRCDYPIVEIHELSHVFGFDHSPNPNSIMYNTSSCNQRISKDMVELINKLYSIEALADARIDELNATKKGKYLDFNISILNEGLWEIDNITLTITADGKEVQTIDIGEIDIGYGRTLKAENVKLPTKNVKKIDFIIDKENAVKELNKDNNLVEMVVDSQ